MMFPRFQRPHSSVLTVPKLCGGLNVCDATYGVADNQLTDENNLWWKTGTLRTRPGLTPTDTMSVGSVALQTKHIQVADDPVTVAGLSGRLLLATGKINQNQSRLDAVLLQTDGSMVPYVHDETYLGRVGQLLPISDGDDATSLGMILSDMENRPLLRLRTDGTVTDVPPYIPTILLRAGGNNTATLESPNGYAYESYNMLTDAFRIEYAVADDAVFFHLPTRWRRRETVLTVNCVSAYSTVTHTVDTSDDTTRVTGYTYRESGTPADGYRLMYNADTTAFWLVSTAENQNTPLDVSETPYVTLTATFQPTTDNPATRAVITGMRLGTWFGGDRSGLGGGTRFFVSGNPNDPSLVHYSSINDATYFPENNYAYVGHPAQAVTALKKQGNMLVIFKKREIYYATYQAGQTAATDIVSGAVTDVESAAAAFPLTPLSSEIGCDCPNSLALCGNRLVWLNHDGRVYTLQGSNAYSGRNVRPISAPIEPLLRQHRSADLYAAKAVNADGTYYLLVGHTIYLFRHGDAGFDSLSSYGDDEVAGKHIAWHRWTLPNDITPFDLQSTDTAPVLLSRLGENVVTHTLNGEVDRYYPDTAPDLSPASQTVAPIGASFCTKDFDFGHPEQRKHIQRLFLDLGQSAAGRQITVQYRSENGDERNRITLPAEDTLLTLLPNMRRVRRFGIRCEATGSMECCGLIIRCERG